jgi:hypothetical protein
MRIERIWSMPSKNTFEIKPIKEMLDEEITVGLWIDPFANKNKLASVTNDLNPEYDTTHHLDALDFLKLFKDQEVDGVLYDPPFSVRQSSECYKKFGIEVTQEMTRSDWWTKHKKEISRILKKGWQQL